MHLLAQEETLPSQAEKTADSILNEFRNSDKNTSDTASTYDQEKLAAAEEKYMDNFLQSEKNKEDVKKYKTYLQVIIGIVFLLIFFITVRNNRSRKVQGR